MVKVDRAAHAARTLFLQVFRKDTDDVFAAGNVHVQVFIEILRRAEPFAVRQAEVDFPVRVITDVCPWTENSRFYQRVLVEAAAQKNAPPVVFPFIL